MSGNRAHNVESDDPAKAQQLTGERDTYDPDGVDRDAKAEGNAAGGQNGTVEGPSEGGEDESSTEHDGRDDHLHEDQKPTTK
jgi:hypothetical protein